MPLTDVIVRKAEARSASYKLPDGRGLYLLVMPNGHKYWRMRYSWRGKENTLAFGVYPDVSLKMARMKRDEARLTLAQGLNPKTGRASGRLFEDVAREWFAKNIQAVRSEGHAQTVLSRLEHLIFPSLGHRPAGEITAQDILNMLRPLEARGVLETAHRVLQICGQVLRYAVARGEAERDPTADLRGALPPKKPKHHASLTDTAEVAGLVRAIESFTGGKVVHCALRFSLLTFARPGEIRHAEWSEVDLDAEEWRIPAEKMKKRRPHIVPLSRQAAEVLVEMRGVSGHGRYVFPSLRNLARGDRPMSENTIAAALRRMGYEKEQMSAHGFRSLASTLLHENDWPSDVIERQLAHVEGNAVRAAYNHAEYLPERRRMMQWWADYLDELTKK